MYTHLTERVHRSATQPPAMVNFHENEQETNSIMHGPSNVLGGRAQTISSPIHRGPRASSTEVPIAPAPEVFIPPPSPPPPPPVAAEAAAVAKGGASSPLSPRPEIRPGPLNRSISQPPTLCLLLYLSSELNTCSISIAPSWCMVGRRARSLPFSFSVIPILPPHQPPNGEQRHRQIHVVVRGRGKQIR